MRHHYRSKDQDLYRLADPTAPLNSRLNRVFRRVENQNGNRAEEIIERTLQNAELLQIFPEWLTSWRRTAKWSVEDRRGVDFEFTTDVGVLNIDVKSSRWGLDKFARQNKGRDTSRPLLVDIRQEDHVAYCALLETLRRWRNEKLKLRSQTTTL